jgi:hypothetical protein
MNPPPEPSSRSDASTSRVLTARCAYCGSDNREAFRFCRRCGRARTGPPTHPSSRAPSIRTSPPSPRVQESKGESTGPPKAVRSGTNGTAPPRIMPSSRPVIGPAVKGGDPQFAAFLRLDADARFDLLALNQLDLPGLVRTAESRDKDLLRKVGRQADSLLPRVIEETRRPVDVGNLVRQVLRVWYGARIRSTISGQPFAMAPTGWGGLFYESRVTGGRRIPRLADRLTWMARGQPGPTQRAGWIAGRSARSLHEASPTLESISEEEVFPLEIAQALIDDLANLPSTDSWILPLGRVTDLGQAHGVATVNRSIQRLFPAGDKETFLLLDPHRHLGDPRVTLRWPDERRGGATAAYLLVVEPPPTPKPGVGPPELAGTSTLRDPMAMWEEGQPTPDDWKSVLIHLREIGGRLPSPPPSDRVRKVPGYIALRALLLRDSDAQSIFEQVRWRERPLSLMLLNRLLIHGSFSSEIETDAEYLQAELNDLAAGDSERTPPSGVWTLSPLLEVSREVQENGAMQFKVSRRAAE